MAGNKWRDVILGLPVVPPMMWNMTGARKKMTGEDDDDVGPVLNLGRVLVELGLPFFLFN